MKKKGQISARHSVVRNNTFSALPWPSPASLLGGKGRPPCLSMACREGKIPSGVRTREDASQKRFEKKRGGNCGNESRPTSKEQTEAHDFKKDALNVSREGRM